MADILKALDSFLVEDGGETFDIRAGELFESDHPVVKKHPKLFGPITLTPPSRATRGTPGRARELATLDDAAFLALLTTDSGADQVREIAERLRDEVVFPVEFDGSLVSFTASVMVGMIGSPRPTIEKVQSKLDVVARLTTSGEGNRTEIVTF